MKKKTKKTKAKAIYKKQWTFGNIYVKSKRVVSGKNVNYYPYLCVPYSIRIERGNSNSYTKYCGSLELYNIKTKRLLYGFWKYLYRLGNNQPWFEEKTVGEKYKKKHRV